MRYVWQDACERAGATWVEAPVPVPCTTDDEIVEAVWAGVTERTRVLFVSHITSPTAIRFPVEELCRRARAAGILSVVDGAHGPGQLDLDLEALGADVYAGNCHKWLCAPKGSGFLWARPELRDLLRPHVLSWGARSERFAERHGRHGTTDPSAYLALPAAIAFHREHLAPARGGVPRARGGVRAAPGHAGRRTRAVPPDGERRASAVRRRRRYAGVCGRSTGSRSWRKSGTTGRYSASPCRSITRAKICKRSWMRCAELRGVAAREPGEEPDQPGRDAEQRDERAALLLAHALLATQMRQAGIEPACKPGVFLVRGRHRGRHAVSASGHVLIHSPGITPVTLPGGGLTP